MVLLAQRVRAIIAACVIPSASLLLICSLAALPGRASERAGSSAVTIEIGADALPLTPEMDRLVANLELRPGGWRVSTILPAGNHLGSHSPGEFDAGEPSWRKHLVSHLQFVLSDIDADDDLDVIVVDRHSGRAQSVWRNNGSGPLERLAGNRFGKTRFPNDRLGRHDSTSVYFDMLAVSGACLGLQLQTTDALRRILEPRVHASDPLPAERGQTSCLGRAPPHSPRI